MSTDVDIVHQRCFNHLQREAVARCPECKRFFCRECVTEHEDRVICADCLAKIGQHKARKKVSFRALSAVFRCLAGFLLVWLVFYFLGRGLLRLPHAFHDGTLWRDLPIWEEE